jgi:hypothetical protein
VIAITRRDQSAVSKKELLAVIQQLLDAQLRLLDSGEKGRVVVSSSACNHQLMDNAAAAKKKKKAAAKRRTSGTRPLPSVKGGSSCHGWAVVFCR